MWKRPEEFDRIVIGMSVFHISCAFLAIIEKCFGDVGLSNLLVESEVIGQGSVTGIGQCPQSSEGGNSQVALEST